MWMQGRLPSREARQRAGLESRSAQRSSRDPGEADSSRLCLELLHACLMSLGRKMRKRCSPPTAARRLLPCIIRGCVHVHVSSVFSSGPGEGSCLKAGRSGAAGQGTDGRCVCTCRDIVAKEKNALKLGSLPVVSSLRTVYRLVTIALH